MALLTSRDPLAEAPNDADLIHIVDVSDITDNAGGSSRKITIANLFLTLTTAIGLNTAKRTYPLADETKLAGAEVKSDKDAANGYAGLDASSKINPLQLPALAISETFVVASEVAQLALIVQEGDIAVRTDENKSYIALNATNATMADWQDLLAPTDQVASVFGRQGVVNAQNGDYNAGQVPEVTDKRYMTDAQETKLDSVETNADVTDAGNVGSVNAGATSKATPLDADSFPIVDSAAANVIKRLTFTNLKAFLKTYFDSVTTTLTNKTLDDAKIIGAIFNLTGTSETLVIAHASGHVTMDNAAANTLTVPPNSSVAFATGTRLMVQQLGAGATTIAAGAGVTINAPTTVTLAIGEQYESRGLLKTATDVWELI